MAGATAPSLKAVDGAALLIGVSIGAGIEAAGRSWEHDNLYVSPVIVE